MDCIVVLMTFVLYMAFTGSIQDRTITYSVAYLITLRLWRMKRIYHGLYVVDLHNVDIFGVIMLDIFGSRTDWAHCA